MAYGVKWDGANKALGPPKGVSEEQCYTLHVFSNGACTVSCWELEPDDIEEVIKTGRLFMSVWSGQSQPPVCLGTEAAVHKMVADYGAVWKLGGSDG